MVPYVIRDGDYLSRLAFRLGFDADAVWNHPKNDEIRGLRAPDVLCTGDILYVPRKVPKGMPLRRGTTNRYEAKVPSTTFEMNFDRDDQPLANAHYTYTIEGVEADGTTDGEGKVSFEVPITCGEVVIAFPDVGLTTTIRVGHLDPVDEPSGARQRLKAMGYLKGRPTGDETLDDQALADAIREFQADNGLEVTGVLDEATKAKLREAHGA
jgi:hypothetical protein